MKHSALALMLSLPLLTTGCSSSQGAHHPGLSEDGYGFITNGPVLGPPEHLLPPKKAKNP